MPHRSFGTEVAIRDGLATLGQEALALRTALDETFVSWAVERGAELVTYPALMRVAELARLDYFRNFPHLPLLAAGITREAIEAGHIDHDHLEAVESGNLDAATYVLPSAACFNVYLSLQGRSLESPFHVTTAADCFRREDGYQGLRRLLGFRMREIVCVGDRESVQAHLACFRERIQLFLDALGLPCEIIPSTDPFFDPSAGRAIMARLFPAKEEVVHNGDLAIASLNSHRNFFGERCNITLVDGSHAHTGCVAFGLERWMSALSTQFNQGPGPLRDRVASAAAVAGGDPRRNS